jgi:N-acetylmuramoyl-L-alanine amidase
LQNRLTDVRYGLGQADGVYGTLTQQAVYAFQKVNRLDVDGIAGVQVHGGRGGVRHR